MRTVNDVTLLLWSMTEHFDNEIQEHAETLLGPRTRGSTTKYSFGRVTDRDNRMLTVVEGNEAVSPGCTCYKFYAPELEGRIQAAPLSKVLEALYTVKMRDGEHGQELFIDQEEDENKPIHGWIYVIVGEHKGQEIIFTWHPGPPLKPLVDREGNISLCKDTAVKLHRG